MFQKAGTAPPKWGAPGRSNQVRAVQLVKQTRLNHGSFARANEAF